MASQLIAEKLVKLGNVETISLGHSRCYVVEGEEIAVFRQRDGRIFAAQNRCPHRQGPLSEGLSGGGYVICPLHGHKFSLEDGSGGEGGECLKVYRVEDVEGELVLSI